MVRRFAGRASQLIPDSEGNESVRQAFWGGIRCGSRRLFRNADLSPDGQGQEEEEERGERWAKSGTSVASGSVLPFSTSPHPSLQRRGLPWRGFHCR